MTQRHTPTERIGVNKTEQLFIENDWIFREQVIVDMGIDAQIEYVEEGIPSGKLIGLQIKTGESHFHETDEYYTYYLDETHYLYWTNHSLPVIIVGHIPEKSITIWQYVDKKFIEKTKKQWKINIPKSQILEKSESFYKIENIIKEQTLDAKINKLFLDRELMLLLKNGNKIDIYTEEWHNKHLGRGPFTVILNLGSSEEIVRDWKLFYTYSLDELIGKLFPWADFSIDHDYYSENFDESFYDVYSDKWKETHNLYPFRVQFAEVSCYMIELKLNKVGDAFLDLADYLDN